MALPRLRMLVRDALRTTTPGLFETIIKWRSIRAERNEWRRRIAMVVSCPDNAQLPKSPDAGRVADGFVIMFNGIKVAVDGYYGAPMTKLLAANHGSHEPQEEIVFAEVLRRLSPGSVMVECGAYWAFYSIWFLNEVPQGKAWLIEPSAENLDVGRRNLRSNGVSASTCQAFVGARSTAGPPQTVTIDDFARREGIAHIGILHADVQGAEFDMLLGSAALLRGKSIDYVFVSTHDEDLHERCCALLQDNAYQIAVSVTPEQSFSVDGLIVATRPGMSGGPLPRPSVYAGGTRETAGMRT